LSTPAFPDPANLPDLKAPPGGWPQASDEELLRAMKHGVGDAFDALFERHGGVVMSFISRLTARKTDPKISSRKLSCAFSHTPEISGRGRVSSVVIYHRAQRHLNALKKGSAATNGKSARTLRIGILPNAPQPPSNRHLPRAWKNQNSNPVCSPRWKIYHQLTGKFSC